MLKPVQFGAVVLIDSKLGISAQPLSQALGESICLIPSSQSGVPGKDKLITGEHYRIVDAILDQNLHAQPEIDLDFMA